METTAKLTAEHVKDGVGNAHTNWKLYKLSRPVVLDRYEDGMTYEYVIVSASVAYSGPETYVFPADENGEVTDWGELEGSFQGSLDYERALAGFLQSHN